MLVMEHGPSLCHLGVLAYTRVCVFQEVLTIAKELIPPIVRSVSFGTMFVYRDDFSDFEDFWKTALVRL